MDHKLLKFILEQQYKFHKINHFKILLRIADEFIIEDRKLAQYIRKTIIGLNNDCMALIENKFICRWKSIEDQSIVYTLDKNFILGEELQCFDCKYAEIEDKFKILQCFKKTVHDCSNDYYRKYYNIFKMLSKGYVKINHLENIERKNTNNIEDVEVGKWKIKHFVNFYKYRIKYIFPGFILDDSSTLRRSIVKAKDFFVTQIRGDWRSVFRSYIIERLNQLGDKKELPHTYTVFDLYMMIDFVKNNPNAEKKVEYCQAKNVSCAYCINTKCLLEKDNIECTNSIVERMKERFG